MPRLLKLIPVIDLMGGQVVRGIAGERQAYRPIVSALCNSSEPLTVARQLVDHCAATHLYVADLDALTGGEVQREVLLRLLAGLPELQELWVDAGFADGDSAARLIAWLAAADRGGSMAQRVVPVFGSESLRSKAALAGCFEGAAGVLSLDRRGGQRLDAAGCWDSPALWPASVIVMTLERVGSGAGPDLDTVSAIRRMAPQAMLVGAGGLRTQADMVLASEAGADAWLVASALHDLTLPRIER